MRIAHVSDIHIRNLKFHHDYRLIFQDFWKKIKELNVDLVVNTGDTAHTKTQISPEFVQMTSYLFSGTAAICPMINILGNHDLNLMNADRQDAITPVIDALKNPRIVLLKKSGPYDPDDLLGYPTDFVFWNMGISDVQNWPHAPYPIDTINVGLFHGSIRNCVTDSNFRMTNVEYDTDIFEGLDHVLMGDIHKRQSFNDGRVWYAGSMIQQNFGEDPDKGFLLWDIPSTRGSPSKVEFVELKGNRRFYTVKLGDDLVLPQIEIPSDSRLRISPPRALTMVEQKTIEKIAKKRWDPHDVITLGATNIGLQFASIGDGKTQIENLRRLEVQERLIRDYLKEKKLPEHVLQKILDLNRKYQVAVEQQDDVGRNVMWRILKLGWSNFFNYGEGNVVDFSCIKGLTGIFAPNASGKSSFIDVITETLFDATTKGVGKNIHLINDNKDQATAVAEISANGERFGIERTIERIKYGQRKLEQTKEWGKTSLNFCRYGRGGEVEQLVGELRPETEKNIRKQVGTFEDFILGSLSAQWNPQDVIACRETERKRIFYKFLDLDIFDQKMQLARDESKNWINKLVELEEGGHDDNARELEVTIAFLENDIRDIEDEIKERNERVVNDRYSMDNLSEERIPLVEMIDRALHEKIVSDVREKSSSLSDALVSKKEKLGLKKNELSTLESQVDDFDVHEATKKIEKQQKQKIRLATLEEFCKELDRVVVSKMAQVKLLDEVPCGDQYPKCKFLVNAFQAKDDVPVKKSRIEEIKKEIIDLRDEISNDDHHVGALNEYNQKMGDIESLRRDVEFLTLQIENSNLAAEKYQETIRSSEEKIELHRKNEKDLEHNMKIDEALAALRFKIKKNEAENEEFREQLFERNRALGASSSELEKIKRALETLKETRETCTAFEHYMSAMGKDGIALQILTQKLPLLNEEINKILSQVSEFGAFIEYDPEEQSIRLFLQYGQYKSRLLELGSGAEKFLASLAIRAALLNVSNLPKTNMFIIDEGFGKLDPSYMESIQRMFDYLKSVFDHVIVISHTDVMKDFVDNIIDIVPDDEGYAHIEVGS